MSLVLCPAPLWGIAIGLITATGLRDTEVFVVDLCWLIRSVGPEVLETKQGPQKSHMMKKSKAEVQASLRSYKDLSAPISIPGELHLRIEGEMEIVWGF